ncbi:MAG TPA: hypothetical protein VNO70_27740 [Blastocatellia bacterium]|nr:hypothetical protein [Blastocatellia bacterium]
MCTSLLSAILGTILSAALTSANGDPAGRFPHQTPMSTPVETGPKREVILVAQRQLPARTSRLYALDPDTLEPLGHFTINGSLHSLTASPDGSKLFFEAIPNGSNGCCVLFALDLATRKVCRLIHPSGPAVVTPDGRWLFTQRGNVGIEVFDAKTLARQPTIGAPGGYDMRPSPDSRWLFGTTNWQVPSLDIFDLQSRSFYRHLPIPGGLHGRGVWLGDDYYLFAYDGKQGNLWKVSPHTEALGASLTVALPHTGGNDPPILHLLTPVGERLFLYELFGYKLDRRYKLGESVPGGVFAIDPSSGKVLGHFAPSAHFGRLMGSADGHWLYGVDSGRLQWQGPVRLLKLDAESGEIMAERELATDPWAMAVATLPERFVPQGEVKTSSCGIP